MSGKWFTKAKLEGNGKPARPSPLSPVTSSKSVLDGFLRGVDGSMVPPAARFLRQEDVLECEELVFHPGAQQAAEGKIFLGLLGARTERMTHKPGLRSIGGVPIGIKDDRHIVTIAGSRSGKGRSVLIPNLLNYPGSMLVIDPKGDLATITARHRKTMGHEVKVLDPFGVSDVPDELKATFNPMRMLSPESETLVEDAGLIADALVPGSPGELDPHWDESARQFIETLILHIATAPAYGGGDQPRNLLTLATKVSEAMLPAGEDGFALYDELCANEREDGAVIRGAKAFYERGQKEMQSVLSTVRRHLHFLDYRQMRRVLDDRAAVDLRDLKRKKTTIYLTLPAMRMATCSRWLRLFVNLTLNAAENEPVNPDNPHAVLLCLDEFAVLGTMKSIEDAAGQLAGFNVLLWPILQDLGQLKSLYRDRWETFLGNAGIVQLFGNNDVMTLEWVSKRLGRTRAFNTQERDASWASEMNQDAGQRYSEASHPLLSADEVARFFGRDDPEMRQLIIRPTFAPLVLQRALYDEHEIFTGKFYQRGQRG